MDSFATLYISCNCMYRLILIIGLLISGIYAPLWAQQKKNAGQKSSASPLTAEQLIQSYRFSEAAQTLQKEINAARSAGRSTSRLEADLARANMGADMLRGTERVTFIDSLVVPKADMLQAIYLSSEAGQLVSTAKHKNSLKTTGDYFGDVAYQNELGDRIIYATNDTISGTLKLNEAHRSGKSWGAPTPLEGMESEDMEQDFPFVMPDGVTLYYGAQGEGCLGGYDVFVTRYNADSKQYLKAENMGMPFNSPANDYLLAIDETNNLGWLVTDRNQAEGNVCVYVFIPSTSREIYEMSDANRTEVLHAAQLHSILETQTDDEAVKAAKIRLQNVKAEQNQTAASGKNRSQSQRYIINDATVYTSLTQFRSEAAQRIAQQADEVKAQIEDMEQQLEELQELWAKGNHTSEIRTKLQDINKQLPQLKSQLHTLYKNMRKAELQ